MPQDYRFIHHGARVRWNDPARADYGAYAKDHDKTQYVVHSINGNTKGTVTSDDDIVLIYDPSGGYGEAEVYPYELVPATGADKERIGRYVRQADVFLLSCLKYADKRKMRAEKRAAEAESKLKAYLRSPKHIKEQAAYMEMKTRISELEKNLHQARQDRDYWMSRALSGQNPNRILAVPGRNENH